MVFLVFQMTLGLPAPPFKEGCPWEVPKYTQNNGFLGFLGLSNISNTHKTIVFLVFLVFQRTLCLPAPPFKEGCDQEMLKHTQNNGFFGFFGLGNSSNTH